MAPIYILVGSPSSGKTWVSKQLQHEFTVVEQDDYIGKNYVKALLTASQSGKTVLGNSPFGLSKLMASLEDAGADVRPVFIVEKPDILMVRYRMREHKDIPQGHLTRQQTYVQRAHELNAKCGTSKEILDYLRSMNA